MNETEKKALLKKNEEELKRLTEELKRLTEEINELKDPTSIKSHLKNDKMYYFNNYDKELDFIKNFGYDNSWEYIKKLSLELFRGKHTESRKLYARFKVKELTHEEVEIAANFADEVIDIWNKYMLKIYESKEAK